MVGRIEDYAIIGDLQSAALVGSDGSVDWLCLPRFDSPAFFGRLLGDDRHGYWRIAPASGTGQPSRAYQGETLILQTQWQTATGTARVIDFMPRRDEDAPVLARIVEGVHGTVELDCVLRLRFGYGQVVPWVRRTNGSDQRRRRPGLGMAQHPGQADRARHGAPRHLHRHRGRADPVHADLGRVPSRPAGRVRRLRNPRRDQAVLDRLGVQVHLPGPVPGRGRPLAHHAQGADL